MLADGGSQGIGAGGLRTDLHGPETYRIALIGYIGSELPDWRDRPEVKAESAENQLTHLLCNHLGSRSRHTEAWNGLQFRTETPEKGAPNRAIDVAVYPAGDKILIDGMLHGDFDRILAIECKRLPTPKGKERDPREYLFSQFGSRGGVQRFKVGQHGSEHSLCAMIGYVQAKDIPHWQQQVGMWLNEILQLEVPLWNSNDQISLNNHEIGKRVAMLQSNHARGNGLPDIALKHLWIEM
jgi:hypothetical protein